MQYFLKSFDAIIKVCQTFFLATLGYQKNCNTILKRLKAVVQSITQEIRGKYKRNLSYKNLIQEHIESCNPTASHYRREHAPLRQLPCFHELS